MRPETVAMIGGLDDQERKTLSALSRQEDRTAYAAAHAALRLILSRILSCLPAHLQFDVGPYGKPDVRLRPQNNIDRLHANISHSGGWAAVAVACFPVGVDIELIRWSDDLLQIARERFAREHYDDLKVRSGTAQAELFFRQWTLGEALIKAHGTGFSQPVNTFAFAAEGSPRLVRLDPDLGAPGDWQFGTF